MDLVFEVLEKKELHPDWDEFTLAFWIYVRTCELFSYDWHFYEDNSDKIYQKVLDPQCITEFEIVCSTWAKLFSRLLKVVKIDNRIIDLPNRHQAVIFTADGVDYIADSTQSLDLARVKIGVIINGLTPKNQKDFKLLDAYKECKLSEAYEKCKIVKPEYQKKMIMDLKARLMEEGYNSNCSPYNPFDFAQLDRKILLASEVLNSASKVTRFHDTFNYFTYLAQKLFEPLERGIMIVERYYNPDSDDVVLLITYDTDMENKKFYKIENVNGNYLLMPTDYEDISHFLSLYRGKRNYLFQR